MRKSLIEFHRAGDSVDLCLTCAFISLVVVVLMLPLYQHGSFVCENERIIGMHVVVQMTSSHTENCAKAMQIVTMICNAEAW